MKLGLVAMSGLRVVNPELAAAGLTLPGFVERARVIASLPSLGLLTLGALTPPEIDIQYIEVDDFVSALPDNLEQDFDAVAISSFTAQINTAYHLADCLRKQGVKVILGGLHVTALPEEAAAHADALVLGEAELCWEELTRDLQRSSLKPVYDMRDREYDLTLAPVPRYELLDPEKYNRLTVQTQRGCPFRCEFCASSIRVSKRFKTKPVSQVVNEISRIKSIWSQPFIELADDNTFANRAHGKKLARALAKLDIKWFTETDISVAEDEALLSILADSGCRQLLIGLESPHQKGLHNLELKANWKEQQYDRYQEALHRIQRRGISVNGCFIMGLDGHEETIFEQTEQFVKESELAEVQITLQTPFPGTELYQRLKREQRLLDDEFWDKCTLFDVTYQPQNMSVRTLETGFVDLIYRLYDAQSVRARKQKLLELVRAADN